MRILLYIVITILVIVAGFAIYVRMAPLDADALHVDPSEVSPPTSPNFALMAGSTGSYVDVGLAEVAARVQARAEADGAVVLAGSAEDGHVTYVLRSRLFGFPDVMSIRLSEEGQGTQIDLYSRSIYGYSDMGVNTGPGAALDAGRPGGKRIWRWGLARLLTNLAYFLT